MFVMQIRVFFVFFLTSRLLVVESGLYKNLFVHRVATRGDIWGLFCYACWMCHLIATATQERATPWSAWDGRLSGGLQGVRLRGRWLG
jgi:hypothetical protein